MIRPGDLVRAGGTGVGVNGYTLTAEVLQTSREGARRGHLIVRPVCRGHERVQRDIRVGDVEAHWRRVGARRTAATA